MKKFFAIFSFTLVLALPVGGLCFAKDLEVNIVNWKVTAEPCGGTQDLSDDERPRPAVNELDAPEQYISDEQHISDQDEDEYCQQKTGNELAECNHDSNVGGTAYCRIPECEVKVNVCENSWTPKAGSSYEVTNCYSVNKNCSTSTTFRYRCIADYYSASGLQYSTGSPSGLNCTKCPVRNGVQTTSNAGSTSVNNCTGGGSTPTPQTCTASETCSEVWNDSGSFQNRKCVRKLTDCSTVERYQYRCAAGYYAASGQTSGIEDSANNLNCTRCPKIDNVQSTSDPGGVGKSVCCLNSGDKGSDASGPFVIESRCCAE